MFDTGGGEAYGAFDGDAFFAEESAAVDQTARAPAIVADAKGILGVGGDRAQSDRVGPPFEEQHDMAGPAELGKCTPIKNDVASAAERCVDLVSRRCPRPLSVFFPLSFHDPEL